MGCGGSKATKFGEDNKRVPQDKKSVVARRSQWGPNNSAGKGQENN